MTTPQFSRPGAVDLSALRKPKQASGSGSGSSAGSGRGPGSAAAGSFVFAVTGEESLRTDVVNKSLSVVVVLSVWSPDVPESVQINDTLAVLSEEFGGRFLFATLDASAQPELVSALGIPEVPLVVAALRGQLAPLIQDPLPEAEMRALIEQILKAAAAGGVTGTAEPVGRPVQDLPEPEPLEPESRFPEAEEAMLRGDLDTAVAAYDKALASYPGDSEALEGLARVKLLQRTAQADPAATRAAAAARPDDIEAQLLVADLDLIGGHVVDAFARLLDLVGRTTDTDRDRARRHLLDLFAVVGDGDPRVGKARRALTAALF